MIPKINQHWKFNYLGNTFIGKVIAVEKLISDFKVRFKIIEILDGKNFSLNSQTLDYFPTNSRFWTCLSKSGVRTPCLKCGN